MTMESENEYNGMFSSSPMVDDVTVVGLHST